jgi:peptidyl-prolyl cis-trans isomerase D
MFESIRKHSKIVMFLLFLLIIPSFVLVGIDHNYFSGSSTTVARVAGHKITQQDWDYAHGTTTDRIRAQNPNIDPKILDGAELKYSTLERMVRDRVLNAAVNDLHLIASDASLARQLSSDPAVASLKKADGSIDVQAYEALLAGQGMDSTSFEAGLRRDLSISQILKGVTASAFVTEKQANLVLDPLYQQREIQVVHFDPKNFEKNIKVTDESLEKYYSDNAKNYQLPDRVDVEYVVLNLESIKDSIQISDDDLKAYYNTNVARFTPKEKRKVSHILFSTPPDASKEEVELVRKKAENLVVTLKKTPEQFAQSAKDLSEDLSSAQQGGDLGLLVEGDMVPNFDKVAFSIDKDAVSDVVKTDFGFHIIKVTEIKKPIQPSFNDLKSKIEIEMLNEQSQKRFVEAAEIFTNEVFDRADSLKPVADKLGLKIMTTSGLTRDALLEKDKLVQSPKVIEAIFSEDVLINKRNTPAIDLGSNQLLAARVVKFEPAVIESFEKVKEQARSSYIKSQAVKEAFNQGEADLKTWKTGEASPKPNEIGQPIVISREKREGQPPQVVDASLKISENGLPTWLGVSAGNDGYYVVKVNSVIDRKVADSGDVNLIQQLNQTLSNAESAAYYNLLKKRYKVEISIKKPASDIAKLR